MVDYQLSILGNVNSGTYAKDLFIFLHGLSQVVLFLYVSFSQFNDIFKENNFL